MSICFTAVARGGVVLATFSTDGEDLSREIQKLLETPFVKNEQRRMNRYIFSFYKSTSLTFICASGVDTETHIPLQFLEILEKRWAATIGDVPSQTLPNSLTKQARSLFESCLKEATLPLSKTDKIRRDLDQTQKYISDSVQLALNRGTELERMSTKSEDLVLTSEDFRNQAILLKNKMRCSWLKSMSIYIFIALVITFLILSYICGGIKLSKCINK